MMRNLLLVGAALLVLLGVGGYLMFYSPKAKTTRVTVAGVSEAQLSPDTAVVTLSVVTNGTQALNAQQDNAAKSEAVKKAIEAVLGGGTFEFSTSGYSLEPQQDHYSGKTPKILGYTVRNTASVTTTQLDVLGAIIDAATKAGANSVDGIRYVVGDASPGQGEALAKATSQAMVKAEAMAKALNGRVVRVVESAEDGMLGPRVDGEERLAGMSFNTATSTANVRTPVEAGSVKMRSRVVLVVEIGF
jgi:uncharacterized protein